MIRRSLIAFFEKYKDDSNLKLTDSEKTEIESFIKSNRFHFILRNQILMNPIPKRLKKEETEQQRAAHETLPLISFLDRVSNFYFDSTMTHYIQMTNKTAVDGKGIFQLGLVQDFFKKMKISISEIKIIGDYFDLDCHYNRNFRTEILRNSFENSGFIYSSGVVEYNFKT